MLGLAGSCQHGIDRLGTGVSEKSLELRSHLAGNFSCPNTRPTIAIAMTIKGPKREDRIIRKRRTQLGVLVVHPRRRFFGQGPPARHESLRVFSLNIEWSAVSGAGPRQFARRKTGGAVVGSDQSGQRMILREPRGVSPEASLSRTRPWRSSKRWSDPASCPPDRADKTSGRPRLRCTAWHSRCRAACAGAAKRRRANTRDTRSEPVSLAKPFSRSGTRTFRALGGQRISCLANVDNQKSVLISRGATQYRFASFKRSTWTAEEHSYES